MGVKTYPRLLPGSAPGQSQSGDFSVTSLARYHCTTKPKKLLLFFIIIFFTLLLGVEENNNEKQ